jgi:hypothetical protein
LPATLDRNKKVEPGPHRLASWYTRINKNTRAAVSLVLSIKID